MLARAEAAYSGRIEYHVVFGVPGRPPSGDSRHRFVWSGDDWRCDLVGHSGVDRINHNGKFLEYHATPQPDGRVLHGVRLELPQRFDEQAPAAPKFAGTFWYAATVNYCRTHSGELRQVQDKDVDGIHCKVFELPVSRADLKAFHGFHPPIDKGGLLRFFVAPAFGFVMPVIEHVGANGFVAQRFTASGFESSSGLFFPKRLKSESFWEDPKQPGFYVEYEITKLADINQPIPNDAFEIQLPAGTSVQDASSDKPVNTYIGEEQTTKQLRESLDWARNLVQADRPPGPPSFFRANRRVLIVGAANLVVLAGLALWILRRRRAS